MNVDPRKSVRTPEKLDMRSVLGGKRMRRNRRADWSRRLVRENVSDDRRPDLANLRGRRHGRPPSGRLDAGRGTAVGR